MTQVLILGLAATALNFLLGFTGVLSFGHAAYFGLGAYGCGLTIKYLVPSSTLGLLVGVVVGTIAGAIIGPLIVRLRGVYFAMVTIAFGQVFYFITFRWNTVTGGDDGLGGFERQPIQFAGMSIDIAHNQMLFYYFVLFFFAIAVAAMGILLRSPLGRAQLAIRENERRARFLGPCRCALCTPQQFRRSAPALLVLLRRPGDHDGAGRHAFILGTAAGCGPVRRAA